MNILVKWNYVGSISQPQFYVSGVPGEHTDIINHVRVNLNRQGTGCPTPVGKLYEHNYHTPGFEDTSKAMDYVNRVITDVYNALSDAGLTVVNVVTPVGTDVTSDATLDVTSEPVEPPAPHVTAIDPEGALKFPTLD